ncbi:hypothetical protein ACFFLZ_10795 [Photobacterium aphoticum]|uniref:Malate dehydrogenase n=1 Tax=Photobacterium aphoticum TaxID=754436 RepID=A0A090QVP1_9GAMM|nr:hypothetical protein [Photobacterium aphoticum]KLU98759.1 malate dehydrogenase [Photobacterium aphoticum]PSU55424.1 hypothetical protein C9I90_16435 [Photobacterium aphoticum]GAL06951.1 hypothetical protein JCM19237_2956 [Photobacterium aphoticum]GHA65181.1 hypothetical protein GCM10007086_43480 [Photobacterium aphoticum]
MQAKDLKPGMWVEHQQGIAEVVEVDHDHNTAIIEKRHDHRRVNVHCDDLDEQPQLHTGCDHYY